MPLFTPTSFLWPVWPAEDLSQLSGIAITLQVTVTEGELVSMQPIQRMEWNRSLK